MGGGGGAGGAGSVPGNANNSPPSAGSEVLGNHFQLFQVQIFHQLLAFMV